MDVFQEIVEFLRGKDQNMTAYSVGRAIKEAYGDRAYLVIEGIEHE